MNRPREILRRAEARNVRPTPPLPAPAPVQPSRVAPVVPAMPGETLAIPVQPMASSHQPAQETPSRVAVPRPVRQNSVYHQLMVRHDRMHQSHLKG